MSKGESYRQGGVLQQGGEFCLCSVDYVFYWRIAINYKGGIVINIIIDVKGYNTQINIKDVIFKS